MSNLMYLALMAYFAFVPALLFGLLISLFDAQLGLFTAGVAFIWRFIELILKRKSNW